MGVKAILEMWCSRDDTNAGDQQTIRTLIGFKQQDNSYDALVKNLIDY